MAEALDAVLALAADGSPLTCTLSPESVQVIFFALGFLEMPGMWKSDYFDTVSDADLETILELLANVATEMLP